MPVESTICPDQRLVLTRGWAELTVEEVLNHQRRLSEDPSFDPMGRQLVDLTEVENFGADSSGIRRFVSGDPWARSARRAFVVPNDVTFGMLRMHEMLLEKTGQEIMVFRSLSQAQEWLGLSPDQ